MTYTATYPSPIGTIAIYCNDNYLLRLDIIADGLGELPPESPNPITGEVIEWLETYFDGQKPATSLPLNPQGSSFQQAVWRELLAIPYGRTVTYGEIAQRIADRRGLIRMSAQAVGTAVGGNPIPIIIPCHRVLPHSHKLGNYHYGIEAKKFLLDLEGARYQPN